MEKIVTIHGDIENKPKGELQTAFFEITGERNELIKAFNKLIDQISSSGDKVKLPIFKDDQDIKNFYEIFCENLMRWGSFIPEEDKLITKTFPAGLKYGITWRRFWMDFLKKKVKEKLGKDFDESSYIALCEVPEGKAMFFPIINYVGWYPDDGMNEEEIRYTCFENQNSATNLECTIDGEPSVFTTPIVRAQSPVFALKGSIIGDYETCVCDGYWVMVPALPLGEHVINFHGENGDFILDVTYIVTIVE